MEEMMQEKLPSLANATPEELAHAIFDVLDAKKAQNIKVLRVNDQTIITDYFVICTGNSSTQVKSLMGEVEHKISLRGVEPHHVEGRDNSAWIIADYSHVLVHVFHSTSSPCLKYALILPHTQAFVKGYLQKNGEILQKREG